MKDSSEGGARFEISEEQREYAEAAFKASEEGGLESRLREVGDLRRKRVLDIGRGPSQWIKASSRSAPDMIVGLDIDVGFLKLAIERNQEENAHFCRGGMNVDNLPFAKSTFDVVFCHLTLPYIQDECRAIAEISEVMSNGGVLSLEWHSLGYYIYRLFREDSLGLVYKILSLASGIVHQITHKKVFVPPDVYQTLAYIRRLLIKNHFTILAQYRFDRWHFIYKFNRIVAIKGNRN